MIRALSPLLTAALVVAVLSGCSGEDSEPAAEPTVTVDAGPGSFTPEEQEVVDAVATYYDALLTRRDAGVESAVDGLLTDDLAAMLVPDEKKAVDDAGLWYIGEPGLEPGDVTIDGAAATFTGCQEAAEVFLVPVGDESAGVGSQALGSSNLTVELVREDGQWLIDRPIRDERVDQC